jgi:adsorption protein B
MSQKKYLLGEILISLSVLTEEQLNSALKEQEMLDSQGKEHKPVGQILLEHGFISPNDLIEAIKIQTKQRGPI